MLYKEIQKCRICKGKDLDLILNLGVHCLAGRFPARDEPDPPKVPLELVKCKDCHFVQLKHTVVSDVLYQKYGYRSGLNNTMKNHLQNLVDEIKQIVSLDKNDIVLDIGSNDATLLRCYQIPTLRKIGIDPLVNQFRNFYKNGIEGIPDYFTAEVFLKETRSRKARVVTSIAMFYDLDEPNVFVQDIKEILDDDGIWVLEQSYLPLMLERNSFDTICHEHLGYYALKQIDWLVKRNDLRIFRVIFNEINGGSFRVYICHDRSGYSTETGTINKILSREKKMGLDSLKPYLEFNRRIAEIKEEITMFLENERKKGKKIYVYGASTKGNTFLQFCNINSQLITAAADRNPEKWGCRTPGTNIPIISEEEARAANPDYFLVLPWHFKDEFLKRERSFLEGGGHFIFALPEFQVI